MLRDVTSEEKRDLLWRHNHVQGPAAASPHHLANRHVCAVKVRSRLPVPLDRDERFVHELSYFLVVEAFLLHDVTPVTSAVANGDEDGFFLLSCLLERFINPWIPINRVVGVLEKVRALLMYQPFRLPLCTGVVGWHENQVSIG